MVFSSTRLNHWYRRTVSTRLSRHFPLVAAGCGIAGRLFPCGLPTTPSVVTFHCRLRALRAGCFLAACPQRPTWLHFTAASGHCGQAEQHRDLAFPAVVERDRRIRFGRGIDEGYEPRKLLIVLEHRGPFVAIPGHKIGRA